jgi:hypothetical protein
MKFRIYCISGALITSCLLATQDSHSFSTKIPDSKSHLIVQNSTTTTPTPTEPPKETAPNKPNGAIPNAGEPVKENPIAPNQPPSLFMNLQQALTKKNYREADHLTYQLMLDGAGPISKSQGRLDLKEWSNFSCSDLKEIDRLWKDSTEGNQGFSVQKEIFFDSNKVAQAYQTRIGWRDKAGKWLVIPQYSSINKIVDYAKGKEPEFITPPRGHLPAKMAWEDKYDRRFERVYACNL